jgi:crotonobetainyl-CoA:carnitine CoA-transferase CaiB-like acyl-CoA transferase
MRARDSFVDVDGVLQPAPAPRFSRTVLSKPTSAEHTVNATVDDALADWMDAGEIAALKSASIL